MVGVDPGLAGRCGGVVDQLHQAERPLAEQVAEVMAVQPEAQRHRFHQRPRHPPCLGEELLHRSAEAGQHLVGQPGVGAVEAEVRRLRLRTVRRVLGAQVQLLAVVHPVVGELGAHLLPPPEVGRPALVDLRLHVVGQGEELLQQAEVVVHEVGRHPVVHHVQEADVVACPAQRLRGRHRVVGGEKVGNGERGDRRHGCDVRERLGARSNSIGDVTRGTGYGVGNSSTEGEDSA